MYLRGVKRSTLAGAVLVAVTDVVLLTLALNMYFGAGTSTATPPPYRGGSSPVATLPRQRAATVSTNAAPSPIHPPYRPLRVVPPQTAVQQTIDQSLLQNSGQGAVSLLERAGVFAPATSAQFPAIDAADSSSASIYAMAFTQELLDIHFATSAREQLLAWADYNNAPYSLGDLPSSLGSRVLVTSLTTGPSPVPPVTKWTQFAALHVSWNVSALVVSVNPTWTQALSAGWQPRDPLMGIYDVSGLLSVTSPGHAAVVTSMSFALTLGGASLHPGYGAVALDDWTVN